MKINTIDWQITSNCNRNCNYCFGPSISNELSFNGAIRIVDILNEYGVLQIGLTGGEPLMYPWIEELVEYIHKKGIKVYMSTNCDLLAKYSNMVMQKVDILGIPIDGASEKIHDSIRGKGSFKNINMALQYVMKSNSNVAIKIGTVLNKYNRADINNIADLINSYAEIINVWKIYELIGFQRNIESVKRIETQELSENELKLIEEKSRVKIIYNKAKTRSLGYFFINPKGDVFVPEFNGRIGKEQLIGNLVSDDYESVIRNAEMRIKPENYIYRKKNYFGEIYHE